MKKLWASSVLFIAGATLISGCTITDETSSSPIAPPESSGAPIVADYPSPTGAVDTKLVITLLRGNNLGVSTHQLDCVGSNAVAPTSLAHGDAACAFIADSSNLFTTELVPTDNKKCTDTGNQIIADVFGESDGKHVRVSFQRNNLCNAKVWDSVAPVIGLD